jgi:hypothetical protein
MGKTLDKILKEMKIAKIDTDIKQKIFFEMLNNIRTNVGKYNPPLTEKEFYISLIDKEYAINELVKNMNECKKEGHIQGITLFANGYKKSYICKRCKLSYERNYTSEETREFQKMMRTPMDI